MNTSSRRVKVFHRTKQVSGAPDRVRVHRAATLDNHRISDRRAVVDNRPQISAALPVTLDLHLEASVDLLREASDRAKDQAGAVASDQEMNSPEANLK